MLRVSPFMEEARQEERIATLRRATLKVVQARFPTEAPAAVIERIMAESDLTVLDRWLDLVSTGTLEVIQAEIK